MKLLTTFIIWTIVVIKLVYGILLMLFRFQELKNISLYRGRTMHAICSAEIPVRLEFSANTFLGR